MKHDYILSLGSNIEPSENMAKAEQILRAEQIWHLASSPIDTKPVGYQKQPNFLNSAAFVSSILDLAEFRSYLKDIENRLGRKRTRLKSGPRTIDLDIIFHNGKLIDELALREDYVRIPVTELQKMLEQKGSI